VVVVDPLHQLVPGEDASRRRVQGLEQRELDRGEVGFAPAEADP